MRSVTIEEARRIIDQQDGFDNESFQRRIANVHQLYHLTIEDKAFLFTLIWHYRPETKILTPGTWYGGKLYTIGDVADYMIQKGYTFDALHKHTIPGTYNPSWFRSCVELEHHFDFTKFGSLFLQPAHHHEQRDCPYSLFKSIDGAHRILVLSVLLKQGRIDFQPLNAIVAIPKR